MLVSGYNNIILLPNCTMLYYVFSGPLSLRAYVPEIKFNNKKYARESNSFGWRSDYTRLGFEPIPGPTPDGYVIMAEIIMAEMAVV